MPLRIIHYFIYLFSVIIFLSFSSTTNADSGETYQVNTSSLQVRDAPSKEGTIIGHLTRNDHVTVFNESHGWSQTYYDGQEAWIASHLLYPVTKTKQDTVSTNTSSQVRVSVDHLRIRSGPGLNHSMIGSTNTGNTYKVEQTVDDWHEIVLSDGSTGWIASWLTTEEAEATVVVNESQEVPETSTPPESTKTHKGSLSGYNIVLDAGHGGKDPGSISVYGLFEKDITLSTTFNIANKLREAGATVIMTRSDDQFVSLADRVAISNSYNTHAFISLHYDAHRLNTINGFSTHFYSPFGRDRNLAQVMQSSIAEQVHLKSRGIMESDLYVLRENSDLAILIELGFLTNPNDVATIQTETYQDKVATGITNGLIKYFN